MQDAVCLGLHNTSLWHVPCSHSPCVHVMQLTVRDGRVKRTESVSNSTHPTFNEELQFLVDDPDKQAMSIIVKDDDAFQDQVCACSF